MTSIESYMCNLIAGNSLITKLYFSVDRARDMRQPHCYMVRINFPGIGNDTYKGSELLDLDNCAHSTSLQAIVNQIDGMPTLDQYIMILLKGQNAIRGLYQACCRAKVSRDQAKYFTYTFNNPFGRLAGVTRPCFSFRGANSFLEFFSSCENPCVTFDSLLVVGGLFN